MINIAALNPIAVHWGPFQIHWYGVIIATGVILALIMSVREGRRRGIPEDDFYDYLLWALPIAIICARIYYVVFQWPYYSVHPDEIIAIWDGGIAIYGAILGGFAVMYFFANITKLKCGRCLILFPQQLLWLKGLAVGVTL